MKNLVFRFLFILFASLLALSLAACTGFEALKAGAGGPVETTPQDEEDGGGILDGAGGETAQSSTKQVHEALEQAIKRLTDPEPMRNLLVRFALERGVGSTLNLAYPRLLQIFPNLPEIPPVLSVPTNENNFLEQMRAARDFRNKLRENPKLYFKSPALEALRTKKLTLKEDGDCSVAGSPHADASVSELTPQAEVCVSVRNLRRIPLESLKTQVFSLLVHEIAHMGGASEADAHGYWQTNFAFYYSQNWAGVNSPQEFLRVQHWVELARDTMVAARQLRYINPGDRKVWIYIGEVRKQLSMIPHLFDPALFELRVDPGRPENTGAFLNSVLDAYARITKAFGFVRIPREDLDNCMGEAPLSPECLEILNPLPEGMTRDEAFLIKQLQESVNLVVQNFESLSGFAEAKCINPDLSLDWTDLLMQESGTEFRSSEVQASPCQSEGPSESSP